MTVRPDVTTELRRAGRSAARHRQGARRSRTRSNACDARAGTVVPLLNGIEHMETIRGASCRTAPSSAPASAASRRTWSGPGRVVQTDAGRRDDGGLGRRRRDRRAAPAVGCRGPRSTATRRRCSGRSSRGRRPSPRRPRITQRPIGELRNDPEWRRRLEAGDRRRRARSRRRTVSRSRRTPNGRSSTRCRRS